MKVNSEAWQYTIHTNLIRYTNLMGKICRFNLICLSYVPLILIIIIIILIIIIIGIHRERWWRQLQSYICIALLCERKWLTSPTLAWKALPLIVHKWLVFIAWVIVTLFFLITRLTFASVFLRSAARWAPDVMHHATPDDFEQRFPKR
jgi:hypothetical protein